jgi:hypothetical protein
MKKDARMDALQFMNNIAHDSILGSIITID